MYPFLTVRRQERCPRILRICLFGTPIPGDLGRMNFRETQQNVENQIAQSIDSLEGLTRMAAHSLFEQAGQIAALSALAESVRPVVENGAAQVFEFGRTLNRSGGDLSRTLLDRIGM